MSNLKQAIHQTIAYADYFNFELTTSELHRWLISSQRHSLSQIKRFSRLSKDLSKTRRKKVQLTQQKLTRLFKILPLLSLVPTVKLVALTGSLAMNNARKNDDIDIMIVTSTNTLWLTRPFVFLLLKAFNLRRPTGFTTSNSRTNNTICDNLWLDLSSLKVPKSKQSLYTAHEVLQIKPLLDKGNTYQRFLKSNSWSKKYLANAYSLTVTSSPSRYSSSPWSRLLKPLNFLAFGLQRIYMRHRLTFEYVTPHAAYFHPRTHTPLS